MLDEDFHNDSTACCHFHVDATFPKYLLAAWFSVKVCGSLHCRKCHPLLPWKYIFIYISLLPFIFAILLKITVAIFLPWIHLEVSNPLQLKHTASVASVANVIVLHGLVQRSLPPVTFGTRDKSEGREEYKQTTSWTNIHQEWCR